MKLKSIICLFFILIFYQNILSMDFKKYGHQLIDGIKEGISDDGDTLGEALQSTVQEIGRTSGAEAKRIGREVIEGISQGVQRAMGAPMGSSIPQSLVSGVNTTFGTQGADLGQAGINMVDMIAARAAHNLGAAPGTPLDQALNNFQANVIANTKANLNQLKDDGIRSTKLIAYDLGKKALIAGVAVGTVALAYYLLKKYTHPGSLNKTDLNKSNLIVKSSGFNNGIVSRIAGLFRAAKPQKKLIFGSNEKQINQVINNLIATTTSLRNGARNLKFKSLFLTGPKGTGKAAVVDTLIQRSNLDYIKINSSTFINFEDGMESTAIKLIFNLLKNPKKGIVVVVEEADILLNKPVYKDKLMDLLRWVKVNNSKLMLIVCAENKKSLNKDLLALMDDAIELNLPTKEEREKFLKQRIVAIVKEQKQISVSEIIASIFKINRIEEIIRQTEGFSYSELEVLVNKIKAEILIAKEKFSKEDVENALQSSVASHMSLLSSVN